MYGRSMPGAGAGESSSRRRARAMEDYDAQLARELQNILDEETSVDAAHMLSRNRERSSQDHEKEWDQRHNADKGKGKARYDDHDGSMKRSQTTRVNDYDPPSSSKPKGFTRDNPPDVKSTTNKTPSSSGQSNSEIQYPQSIRDSVEALQQFSAKISSTKCRRCGSTVGADLDVKAIVKRWTEAARVVPGRPCTTSICAVTCKKTQCGADTCLGCGGKPTTGRHSSELEGLTLDWCCDVGRLFAIWLFLARFDQMELSVQARQDERQAEAQEKASRRRATKGKGIGYSDYSSDDVDELLQAVNSGRQSPGSVTFAHSGTMMMDFRSADERTDHLLQLILSFLCELLPSASAKEKSHFDDNPPKALNAMLRLSLLLDKLSELLRNDSIDDLSKRFRLYFASFRIVEILGSNPATLELVANERYIKRQSPGLQTLSKGDTQRGAFDTAWGSLSNGKVLVVDKDKEALTPALVSRFRNLYKQSQIVLGQAMRAQAAFEGKTGQVTLDLCEQIVVTYTKITSSMSGTQTTPGQSSVASEWVKYHEKHALEQTDDVLTSFHLQRGLYELKSLRSPPMGRMQYLIKEIATLATSLPDGIFVKSCLSTPGIFKCLILGPGDTPYEGGLFEFDILAGARCPMGPPEVSFRTTGGGLVDFNPNLYADGKVCLSLLNTFDGRPEERWQPKKSTIISVLVSIQSMILCSEPWRNEPGNNDDHDRYALDACRQYSIDRQCFTVRYAMINWLTSMERRKGLWDDVIRNHFKVHGDEILKTVKSWSRVNPGIRSFREQIREISAVRTYQPGGTDLFSELERLIVRLR